MRIRMPVAIVAGSALVAAAIAVPPALAQLQTDAIRDMQQEILLLKKRVALLEEKTTGRVRPAS